MFDHEIPMNLDENITILHAPNGYGKTVILNMIAGFFGGTLLPFRSHEYNRVEILFESGQLVTIAQGDAPELFPESLEHIISRHYTISAVINGEQHVYDLRDRNERDWRHVSPSRVERYLAELMVRVGPNRWRDRRTGEILGTSDAIEKYGDLLPSYERGSKLPDWLEEIRGSITCKLIETQRLSARAKSSRTEVPALTPAVKHYSEVLATNMEKLLAESANLSQRLDRTFPKRVLARLETPGAGGSEVDVRERLKDLEIRRNRLAAVDLLDVADEDSLITHAHFGDEAKKILGEYIDDTRSKLSVFDNMLQRIELFTELLNSRFQFKKIVVSRRSGFTFLDFKGRPLPVEALSSGEQHELVLAYELIFGTPDNALLLIDEPEISLHIAWQRRFLHDLRRAISLSPMDVLVSTHSPQLVAEDIELVVQLQGPQYGQF